MQINIDLPGGSYPIRIGRGLLARAGELMNLDRRVFLVTDRGVPSRYVRAVAAQCRLHTVFTVQPGEASKSVEVWSGLLEAMLRAGLTRGDCVAVVGGGVVGDLAGFAAASYMRGVDFYNVPTTVLSMADASVGGKTALNLGGVKNSIGAFWQPKAVLIDPDVLDTLPQRQISNGMAEIVKTALTLDADLFTRLERFLSDEPWHGIRIEDLITDAVRLKKAVVEADERESGPRRVLNFGHTLGHGIEAVRTGRLISSGGAEAALREGFALLHGECVALGMLPLCAPEVRARLLPILERLDLPTHAVFDPDAALAAIARDKKGAADTITVVTAPAVGEYAFRSMPLSDLRPLLTELLPA